MPPQRVSLFVKDLLPLNSTKTVRGRLAGLYYMVRALDPGRDLRYVRRDDAKLWRDAECSLAMAPYTK